MSVQAILMDIEGTTTSINFVKKVLFPYAYTHIPDYIHYYAEHPLVSQVIQQVRKEIHNSTADSGDIINVLRDWIDQDRKVTALKDLQGMIWQNGYEKGDFTGHLYADVPQHLRCWKQHGIRLYIFSSGSVAAQKLLFRFSDYGDLSDDISDYFDTNTGHKREPESYNRIIGSVQLPADDVLFLSDTPEECDAARKAGLQTMLLLRNQVHSATAGYHHPIACQFDEIEIVVQSGCQG